MSSVFSRMARAEDYFSNLHNTELLQGSKDPTIVDKIKHPVYARDLDQGKRMLNRCTELVESNPKIIEISDGMKEPFMDYLLYLIDKGHTNEFNAAFDKLNFKDAELFFNKICKCSDPEKYINRISVPIESFIKKNILNEQMHWASQCIEKLSNGTVKESMSRLLSANPKLIYLFNADRKEFTRIFKQASVAKQLSFFKFYVENRNRDVNREVERRSNKLIDLSWLKIGRSEDNFSPEEAKKNVENIKEALEFFVNEMPFENHIGNARDWEFVAGLIKGQSDEGLKGKFKQKLMNDQAPAYQHCYYQEINKTDKKFGKYGEDDTLKLKTVKGNDVVESTVIRDVVKNSAVTFKTIQKNDVEVFERNFKTSSLKEQLSLLKRYLKEGDDVKNIKGVLEHFVDSLPDIDSSLKKTTVQGRVKELLYANPELFDTFNEDDNLFKEKFISLCKNENLDYTDCEKYLGKFDIVSMRAQFDVDKKNKTYIGNKSQLKVEDWGPAVTLIGKLQDKNLEDQFKRKLQTIDSNTFKHYFP